jgi:hypothetical protein
LDVIVTHGSIDEATFPDADFDLPAAGVLPQRICSSTFFQCLVLTWIRASIRVTGCFDRAVGERAIEHFIACGELELRRD